MRTNERISYGNWKHTDREHGSSESLFSQHRSAYKRRRTLTVDDTRRRAAAVAACVYVMGPWTPTSPSEVARHTARWVCDSSIIAPHSARRPAPGSGTSGVWKDWNVDRKYETTVGRLGGRGRSEIVVYTLYQTGSWSAITGRSGMTRAVNTWVECVLVLFDRD